MAETDRTVKKFLYGRMYEHWHLNRSHSKARRVVLDLFGLLFAEPTACRRPGASAPRPPNAPPAPASSPTILPA